MLFNRNINFSENDIESIIRACLSGNSSAERVLLKMHLGFAKMVCYKYASNTEEMEEIVNDSFLKMFNNLGKYEATKPFKAWLHTIIVRTAIDYYRKNLKFNNEVSIDNFDIAQIGADVISKISADEILKLVQQLSPACRLVFTLNVLDGYTHKEIAKMLGIKEGTSKSNLQDARKKLQLMIKNNYPNLYLVHALNMNRINEN